MLQLCTKPNWPNRTGGSITQGRTDQIVLLVQSHKAELTESYFWFNHSFEGQTNQIVLVVQLHNKPDWKNRTCGLIAQSWTDQIVLIVQSLKAELTNRTCISIGQCRTDKIVLLVQSTSNSWFIHTNANWLSATRFTFAVSIDLKTRTNRVMRLLIENDFLFTWLEILLVQLSLFVSVIVNI